MMDKKTGSAIVEKLDKVGKKKVLRTFDVTVPEVTYHTVTVQAETQKTCKNQGCRDARRRLL